MFRDKDQELERLTQALLEEDDDEDLEEYEDPEECEDLEDFEEEEEYLDESDSEEEDWIEELYPTPRDYRAYNTDITDTDLDTYSEEVHSGKRGISGLAFLVWLLTMGVAVAVLYLFLRYGGWL